jgi:type IX secretion system PorP/SprF family membrane protein
MKSTPVAFVLLFMGASLFRLSAQDVAFSQFYSNPMYLNPAFAGSVEVPRVVLQYRNQWPAFRKAYTTYSLGFDFPVEALQGGVGLFLLNDGQLGNALNKLQVSVMYSRFIRLSRQWYMNGAVQAGFCQNSLDAGGLIFPDNLDPHYGNHGISGETFPDLNFRYFDASAGMLFYNETFFMGIAGHHLNKPRQSYSGDSLSVVHRKYTLHAGARFPVLYRSAMRKMFDLSPQIILQKQGIFTQVNYGFFINRKGISGGVWLRQNLTLQNDALIFLVGFISDNWQLTYSFDWTISGLAGLTDGSHEVTLSFLLKDPHGRPTFPFFRSPWDY